MQSVNTSQKTRIATFENQNDKASSQKTHWRSFTSSRKFDDLIIADHNVLNEGCESRDIHRHAVLVQDLADQWIQI